MRSNPNHPQANDSQGPEQRKNENSSRSSAVHFEEHCRPPLAQQAAEFIVIPTVHFPNCVWRGRGGRVGP